MKNLKDEKQYVKNNECIQHLLKENLVKANETHSKLIENLKTLLSQNDISSSENFVQIKEKIIKYMEPLVPISKELPFILMTKIAVFFKNHPEQLVSYRILDKIDEFFKVRKEMEIKADFIQLQSLSESDSKRPELIKKIAGSSIHCFKFLIKNKFYSTAKNWGQMCKLDETSSVLYFVSS